MKKFLMVILPLFTVISCSAKEASEKSGLSSTVQALQGLWGDENMDQRFDGTSYKQDAIPYDPFFDIKGEYSGKEVEVSGIIFAIYNITDYDGTCMKIPYECNLFHS
ncbi:MAG: hypothetical protein ACRCV0_06955 [Brevinema sp.]